MKARAKFGITLVAIMLLSSLSPLMTVAAPGATDGEDRQGDGPLEAEDAMVQYAILTSFSFLDEFERLAEWKTEKGYYAKVYSTDWVSNHYPGDTMAQYHAWLEDMYDHTGGGLQYLLIGADDEIVRAREIWTGIKAGWEPYSGSWVYSDHYYAGLSHDWDLDNDGKYGELGETDWDAEIAVGRAPVSSSEEAADGDEPTQRQRYQRPPTQRHLQVVGGQRVGVPGAHLPPHPPKHGPACALRLQPDRGW